MIAPEGALIGPQDVQFVVQSEINPQRPVVAWVRSPQHLYELVMAVNQDGPESGVFCEVDGVAQTYISEEDGIDLGESVAADMWGSWILDHSVPAQTYQGPAWEGDGAEVQLLRIGKHIVEFEDHETDVGRFTSADELAEWLKKSLGTHNATLGVLLLGDVAYVLNSKPMWMQWHKLDRNSGLPAKVRYKPWPFQPWEGSRNWSEPGHCNPTMLVTMDGARIEQHDSHGCLGFSELGQHQYPDGASPEPNAWFTIHLEGTDTCISFPWKTTILQVSLDNDGATAVITARDKCERSAEHHAELMFKEEWANWLDEEHQLDTHEIQHGHEKLQGLIEGRSK